MIPFSWDVLLHLDRTLNLVAIEYGLLVYAILFLIIFIETGIVIFPFLPGDSLLFIAGALAAAGALNSIWLFAILILAAVLGDTVNYSFGRKFGELAFNGSIPFLNQSYLDKTKTFYERHGKKTIVIARFIPIIRTFAPFVAGIGKMEYKWFLAYNVVGSLLWVAIFLFAGYFLGNVPIIKENLGIILIGIIVLSLLVGMKEILQKK